MVLLRRATIYNCALAFNLVLKPISMQYVLFGLNLLGGLLILVWTMMMAMKGTKWLQIMRRQWLH